MLILNMFEWVTSPTKEKYPLSPYKPVKKSVGFAIILSIIIAVLFIVSVLFSSFISALFNLPSNILFIIVFFFYLVVFVVLVTLWYIYEKLYVATYFYDIMKDIICIKKGVFTPNEINIPFDRVQDIYVDQDILDRIFSLYDVHLSTATSTSNYLAHIDGVEKEAAEGLRSLLLELVKSGRKR